MTDEAPTVVLTADGSLTLESPSGEGYKSRHGALLEASGVYLEGSGVAARLAEGLATSVLEVGFGTGLSFLVTARAALAGGARLTYRALEIAPPPAATMRDLRYAELLAPSRVPTALTRWRAGLGQPVPPGWHTLKHGRVTLELYVGDALDTAWEEGGPWRADAVYHDAFSPATAPAMWTAAFLGRLARHLAPGGRLVSFTVAGSVRRVLAACGLQVLKVPGPPGGKREVLVATRPEAGR